MTDPCNFKTNMAVLKCPTRYFRIKFTLWGSIRVRISVVIRAIFPLQLHIFRVFCVGIYRHANSTHWSNLLTTGTDVQTDRQQQRARQSPSWTWNLLDWPDVGSYYNCHCSSTFCKIIQFPDIRAVAWTWHMRLDRCWMPILWQCEIWWMLLNYNIIAKFLCLG